MTARARIILGNASLADYPEAGGHWMYFLQYPLGLLDLGHEVLWLELYRKCGDEARDRQRIETFFGRLRQYGLEAHAVLACFDGPEVPLELAKAEIIGRSRAQTEEFIASADLLWNFAAAVRQPLLGRFKRRVLLDGDPGHLQVSALDWDLGQSDHQVFLTAGTKLHDADCEVPTLGLKWHPFLQFVYLPLWKPGPDPGAQAPFTSVTQWTWHEIWMGDRVLSIAKRDAFLRYLELPQRAGRPFELAANIDTDDNTGDRELLRRHGWQLVHPHQVCPSPAAYQDYLRRSRAEICCPKPIYRELKTGWFSDRSAGYLASGRPVLAEDTGFKDHYATGRGFVVFNDLNTALAGAAEIDGNYAAHSRAAREFAEAYLDSRRCLTAMLQAGA